MERFGHLLLAVWREACRHTEIGDALAESAERLFSRLPIDLVLIRRLDVGRQVLETVASGNCRPCRWSAEARTEFTPAEFDRLLAWCHAGSRLVRAWFPAICCRWECCHM